MVSVARVCCGGPGPAWAPGSAGPGLRVTRVLCPLRCPMSGPVFHQPVWLFWSQARACGAFWIFYILHRDFEEPPSTQAHGPSTPTPPPSIHVSCFPYCIRVALSSAKGFCRAWSHLQAVPGDQGSQAEVSSSLHTYENVFMALSFLISILVVFAFLCCFVF